MTTIRRLREAEISSLVEELWVPFAEETAEIDDHDVLADEGVLEHALEYRREQFENDDRAMFVAVEDDALVGYVSIQHRESRPMYARGDDGHVHELYLAPEHRGQGLASDLLEQAADWANDHGCEHLKIAVHPDNEPARSIYREWGFEQKREWLSRPL